MAVTLKKDRKLLNLGKIVQRQSDEFILQRQRLRDKVEGEFARRVMDEGLAYSEQLTFFEGLLEKEKKKSVSDQSYVKTLKNRITSYKKLVRAEKFADEYRKSFNALIEGRKSLDDHMTYLETELDTAIDADLKSTIEDKVDEAVGQRVIMNKNLFNNKITFAENDKSEEILTAMITEVKNKIGKVEPTDEEYASALRLSLQSLEGSLQSGRLESDIQDAVLEGLNNPNPVIKLNKLNSLRAAGDTDAPININGVRYDSVNAFWEQKRSEYLESGDFFTEVNEFFSKKMTVANIRDKELLPVIVKEIKANMDALVKRKDLVEYQEQLADTVDLTVAYGAGLVGQNVVSKAKSDYNFDFAAQKLSEVNRWSGVDMTEQYQAIVDTVASLNFDQAQMINQNAQDYLGDNPNASFGTALDWALKATPNMIISPEELATKKPGEVLKERVDEGKGETPTIKPTEKAVGGGARAITDYKEGDLIKTAGSPTVYRFEGGKLRSFTGAWDEDVFKAQSGKSFKDVQVAEDISGFERGQDIIKKQATLGFGDEKPVVVDVGSAKASELQKAGWKLV